MRSMLQDVTRTMRSMLQDVTACLIKRFRWLFLSVVAVVLIGEVNTCLPTFKWCYVASYSYASGDQNSI